MRKKQIVLAALCVAALVAMYAVSVNIYLSYQDAAKAEVERVLALPSTDLSGLSFNGYKVGQDFVMASYPDQESVESGLTLTFENYQSRGLLELYRSGETVDSRVVKITTRLTDEDNITAYYNNAAIPNQKRLEEFFGPAYLEVLQDSYDHAIIYVDHENHLQLKVGLRTIDGVVENGYLTLEEFAPGYYQDYVFQNKSSGWDLRFYNPIYIILGTVQQLGDDYSIFRLVNYGFSNDHLVFFPLAYLALLVPVFALIVFRTQKLLMLNAILPIVYLVWFLGVFFTIRV